MIALQVVKDRFATAAQIANGDAAGRGNASRPFIRRPTRGTTLREETFATLRLVAGIGGHNLPLVDAGSRRMKKGAEPIQVKGMRATDIYSNFFLQQISEERVEKQQILETFGEPYIFLFGERARILTFQGILLNTGDFNWEAEWWYNYDNFLRGTQAVESDARVFLSYDQTLVSGYIIAANSTKNSQEPNHVNFQFQLFLTSYNTFSALGNPNALPGFPIDPQHPEGQAALTPAQLVASNAAAAQFRPVLIPNTIDIKGNTDPTTLDAGFENAIGAVEKAWGTPSELVSSTFASVSQWMNGDTVRVPIGFAGALAFDVDDSATLLTEPQYGLPVKYSTYAEDNDEYVAVGDHYGSSSFQPSFITQQGYDTQESLERSGILAVESASAQWRLHGFDPDDAEMGPVASAIISKSLGLIAVGATSLIQKANSSANPGSASSALGRGINASVLPE